MLAHKWRQQLITNALDGDYLSIKVKKLSLNEDLTNLYQNQSSEEIKEITQQSCEVILEVEVKRGSYDTEPAYSIDLQGKGVGLIDASFEALVKHFADEYQSLKSIQFASFAIKGEAEQSKRAGADAKCTARLVIHNSDDNPLEFEESGHSMAAVSLFIVLSAVEHFINAERAFISLYRALEDAKKRGRQDLVESFTSQLSELVKTTSYSEVIAQLRSELNV